MSIWAWTETSRADTGSSHTTSRGDRARARARPTSCRWPPKAGGGYRSSRSGARPTWVSRAAPGRRIPPGAEVVDAQGLGQGLAHGPPGVQGGGGVLKHQLHLPPEGPEPGRGQGGQVLAVKEHLPLGRGQQPQQEPA